MAATPPSSLSSMSITQVFTVKRAVIKCDVLAELKIYNVFYRMGT